MTVDTHDNEAGDPLEHLTAKEKEAVQKLKDLHHEHAQIETEFEKELRALKRKYQELYSPLYSKRSDMLTKGDVTGENGTTVPQFWLQAMKNHPMLADMIEENDEAVLAYLQDISTDNFSIENSDKMGFSLTFTFASNPYFEPLNLVKTYHMELQPNEKDPALVRTVATEIDWKPGKDITKKVVTRKQKNKRTKQVRKLTETVSVPSFFNFFTKHDIPSDAELEQMNEDQIEELEVVMEADYEAGVILKDRLVPKAVVWYTGEAVDSEIEDMDDRDAADDDDDDEVEEPEDEEEEEGEDGDMEAKPRTKKRTMKHKKKADQQGCKQQ
eukprot:gnl/MRDRNA2_/MRDRNA2_90475_c0_seq1.p1 gnl/MRDRNA2_/MRDRNA2_90475_c0~~gnl/MRDRNA2_/MRDRNA2_90475_c0_seq1.p1  ORF type:complete len:327 (+),score=112.41 gnl/MRDRNA2_/MRDRNA2_90475_c0_seq1:91-1071(+)